MKDLFISKGGRFCICIGRWFGISWVNHISVDSKSNPGCQIMIGCFISMFRKHPTFSREWLRKEKVG